MKQMIRKIQFSEFIHYYIDDVEKRKYGRIIGGFDFPGSQDRLCRDRGRGIRSRPCYASSPDLRHRRVCGH